MNREPAEPTDAADRERLSALADGELPAQEVAALVRRWAVNPTLREDWHSHQVIGDALRSDELAGSAQEARFLAKLRQRLAQEPVVLAPGPVISSQGSSAQHDDAPLPVPAASNRVRRPRWAQGAAVAAGFAAVAAVLLALQPSGSDRLDGALAGGPSAPALLPSAATGGPQTVPVGWVAGGLANAPVAAGSTVDGRRMIRDARLDAYLDAHRQLGTGSWQSLPTATQQGPSAASAR